MYSRRDQILSVRVRGSPYKTKTTAHICNQQEHCLLHRAEVDQPDNKTAETREWLRAARRGLGHPEPDWPRLSSCFKGEKPKLKLNLIPNRAVKPELKLTWSAGLLPAGSRRSLAVVLLRPLNKSIIIYLGKIRH